jgi:hypothetical protein
LSLRIPKIMVIWSILNLFRLRFHDILYLKWFWETWKVVSWTRGLYHLIWFILNLLEIRNKHMIFFNIWLLNAFTFSLNWWNWLNTFCLHIFLNVSKIILVGVLINLLTFLFILIQKVFIFPSLLLFAIKFLLKVVKLIM